MSARSDTVTDLAGQRFPKFGSATANISHRCEKVEKKQAIIYVLPDDLFSKNSQFSFRYYIRIK